MVAGTAIETIAQIPASTKTAQRLGSHSRTCENWK